MLSLLLLHPFAVVIAHGAATATGKWQLCKMRQAVCVCVLLRLDRGRVSSMLMQLVCAAAAAAASLSLPCAVPFARCPAMGDGNSSRLRWRAFCR